MSGYNHFAKGYYKDCDRQSPFMLGVYSANRNVLKVVLEEFERVRGTRELSQRDAVKGIKMLGGFLSRQNITKYKSGVFSTCSITYLNVVSRWCGYSDFVELCIAVRMRESSQPSVAG